MGARIMTAEPTINTTSVLRTLSNQMADAVERISPALVVVNGRQRQPASGIVYAQDRILTANHVLERADQITIQTHDERTLPAQVIGRDPATDLAVLRVADLGLQAAPIANEQARVGQLVIALGRNPTDGPMASVGIVSTVSGPLRTERGGTVERYIRTDAIPYPGFSGGPLIDAEGRVVGMLTTGLVDGIPLALPLDIVAQIAETLTTQGIIKRGYLGISSQLIELPTAQRAGRSNEHGLLIVRVEEQSPAQQAGVLIGDILLTLDGHTLNDAEDLHLVLTGDRVGKTIPLEVIRGDALHTLNITVGQRK
jgi:S1-C subfamily serine protease